jgi:hypothetical protein
MREYVLLFCLELGAHSHDHTGNRTGSRDLGAGPHRMMSSGYSIDQKGTAMGRQTDKK